MCLGTFSELDIKVRLPSACLQYLLINLIFERTLSTLAATELSRLVAVGYLAGILELHSFWERRIKEDLHSLSDVLCLIELRLLEDLATDCETRHLEKIQDLVTMDPEGINRLIFATMNSLPLRRLPASNIRTVNSLAIAQRLVERLQTQVICCLPCRSLMAYIMAQR